MIAMLTAAVVLLASFSNISTLGKGRHHLRPPEIGRTVTVDQAAQSQLPAAQETSPAKDVSPVVATAPMRSPPFPGPTLRTWQLR